MSKAIFPADLSFLRAKACVCGELGNDCWPASRPLVSCRALRQARAFNELSPTKLTSSRSCSIGWLGGQRREAEVELVDKRLHLRRNVLAVGVDRPDAFVLRSVML